MQKRKKKHAPESPPRQKEKPFHAPFVAVAQRARRDAERATLAAATERSRKGSDGSRLAGGAPASGPVAAPPAEDDGDETKLFLRAVEGARTLPAVERAVVARAPTPPRLVPENEEVETMARLADLCAGTGPFDLADTSEYVEGSAPGVDRGLVRRLRKGEFSVQAHLDLHGMTRDEAQSAALAFLTRSRLGGLRCVLLVHGRGKNSKDNIPVLKQSVASWLRRGRLARGVLAFATARPHDGGAGALYVLLRR